jgi:hypothetical protein
MYISEDQICQSFDPMMILKEKNITYAKNMNTSCLAPAYVYLEGSRGKRFLCDFHYAYEKNITINSRPNEWKNIALIFSEKLELIKDTFDKTIKEKTIFQKCWCYKDAFVSATTNDSIGYFCNFHYRKNLYRFLSNDIDPITIGKIKDERIFFKKTIIEEIEELIQI